jgi:hypothetical protein
MLINHDLRYFTDLARCTGDMPLGATWDRSLEKSGTDQNVICVKRPAENFADYDSDHDVYQADIFITFSVRSTA